MTEDELNEEEKSSVAFEVESIINKANIKDELRQTDLLKIREFVIKSMQRG